MIISHKHKYIFIKTAKVGGTSLELALRKSLGSDDIATPVIHYDEDYAKANGFPPPQNYSPDYYNILKYHNGRGCLYEHSWADQVKAFVGDKIWNDYFTFTIDRNPLEKSVSNFYHFKQKDNRSDYINIWLKYFLYKFLKKEFHIPSNVAQVCNFENWIHLDKKYAYGQNYLRYTIDDKIIVKKVYDYKDFKIMVEDLSNRLDTELILPNVKQFVKKDKKDIKKNHPSLNKILENKIYMKEYKLLCKSDS